MKMQYKDEILNLEYTFNSFRFMEELDLSELSKLDRKPFKMVGIAQILLIGALNHNPKVIFDDIKVMEILEVKSNEGKLFELLEKLIELLQESSFFKNLQESPQK